MKTRNSWGTVKLNIFGGDLTIQRGTLGPSHESELLEIEGMRDGPARGAVSSGSVYDMVVPGESLIVSYRCSELLRGLYRGVDVSPKPSSACEIRGEMR